MKPMPANGIASTLAAAICGRLAKARRMRGVTQEQAAEVLGTTPPSIAEVEDGIRRPEAWELYALSRLYGRSLGDLLRPDHEADPAVVAECLAAHAKETVSTEREHERHVQRCEDVSYWYAEFKRMLGSSAAVTPRATLQNRFETLAAQAYAAALISEGQLARILAMDRLSALQIARERLQETLDPMRE